MSSDILFNVKVLSPVLAILEILFALPSDCNLTISLHQWTQHAYVIASHKLGFNVSMSIFRRLRFIPFYSIYTVVRHRRPGIYKRDGSAHVGGGCTQTSEPLVGIKSLPSG